MEAARRRQILNGLGILAGVVAVFLLLGWATRWPGFPGELARMLAGVFTTPTLLEPAFLFLGLVLVLLLNGWRRQRDGSEWVYLEQVAEKTELPEHARFAVYRDPPLTAQDPEPLTRAEGAIAIGDFQAARDALAELSARQLESPRALDARIRLAEATGRHDLAADLASRIEQP